MAQIGIKLADHTFYPVINDETPQRKRMVLSPAQQQQTSIQVDLVRRSEDGDQSIGCLVLENVQAGATSEFELVVGVDEAGNVDAKVSDSTSEHFQSLSINLSQLDVGDSYSVTAIGGDGGDVGSIMSIDDEDTIHDSLARELSDDLTGGLDFDEFPAEEEIARSDEREDEVEDVRRDARPFSPLLLTAILLIALSLLALGAFGVFSWLKADSVPELRTTRLFVDHLFAARG